MKMQIKGYFGSTKIRTKIKNANKKFKKMIN